MEKDKKLMEACRWERLRGNLGLVLMGRAMLSKSLIQFSVDGWSCVPSLLFTWGQTMVVTGVHPTPGLLPGKSHGQWNMVDYSPWGLKMSSLSLFSNYGGGNEDNGDLPEKIPCMYYYTQCL